VKTPGRIRDRLSPLEYAKLICESNVKSGEPFTDELVKELALELKAYVPRLPLDIARKYISLKDPTAKKEEKKESVQRKKRKKKSFPERRKDLILNFAISCVPYYIKGNVEDKTILAVELQREFQGLKFLTAQNIVDKAVRQYEKIKDIKPELKPADKLLPKKREISSLKEASTPQRIEEIPKKPEITPPGSSSETAQKSDVRLLPRRLPRKDIKIDDRDKKIIFQFSLPKVAAHVFNYLKIPKSTFYRKLKKLTNLGLIKKIDEGSFCRFVVSPRFQKSLEMGLVVSGKSSPKIDMTSKTAPISEHKDLVQDSKSHSGVGSVPNPSKSAKRRAKNETRYCFTSKNLSFQELVSKFDLNNIRSHSYLFTITILKAPVNYFEMLDRDGNWLERHEGMKNWPWYRGVKRLYNIDSIIRFYPNKITVRILEIYGPNAFVNDSCADLLITEILGEMEDKYNLTLGEKRLLEKWDSGKAHIKSTHHALPFHPVALIAMEKNYSTKTDRFEIDASPGVGELESIHKNFSTEDIDRYIQELTKSAKTDYWLTDAKEEIRENGKNVNKTAEVLKEVSETQTRIAGGIMTNFQITEAALQSSFQAQQEIQELKDQLQKPKEEMPGKKSLSLQQKLLLDIIRTDPGKTRLELSKKYNIKRGSVNGQVKRLKTRFMIFEEEGRLYSIEKLQRR